jgi:hypothetical protein
MRQPTNQPTNKQTNKQASKQTSKQTKQRERKKSNIHYCNVFIQNDFMTVKKKVKIRSKLIKQKFIQNVSHKFCQDD